MKKRLLRPISILLSIILILSVFTIVPVTTAGAATVTDVLTADDFTASGSSYVDFSAVSKDSGAVYAGNSARNGDNIQLRSKNSNSGIVSTTSGGTVQSVKITVGSGSGTVNVYGSNTAYSNAEDLYSSSTQGTLIDTCTA